MTTAQVISEEQIAEAFRNAGISNIDKPVSGSIVPTIYKIQAIVAELDTPRLGNDAKFSLALSKCRNQINAALSTFIKAEQDQFSGVSSGEFSTVAQLNSLLKYFDERIRVYGVTPELSVTQSFVINLAQIFKALGGTPSASSREQNGKSEIDGPFVRLVAVLSGHRVSGKMVRDALRRAKQ